MRRPVLTLNGVKFRKNVREVGFGGIGTTLIQVLKNSMGYYIGRLWFDDEFGKFTPIQPLKTVYWKSRYEAEKKLIDEYNSYNNS
jgi:hypothetical protein